MSKHFLLFLVFVSLASFSTITLAKEPANLVVAKQALIKYHDSGDYDRDINAVIIQAMRYLDWRMHQPMPQKPAIILDIDETALSNYNDMVRLNFGGTLEEILQDEDKGQDPAIKPTLRLYRFAKAHHIAVFFLTGRQEAEREATAKNLQQAGYTNWDGLILRSAEFAKSPATQYKIAMRKKISKQGYEVILNIGDQKSDLTGGYAEKTYKLPGPFYFIA